MAAYYAVPSGVNGTISGGEDDGMNANAWAQLVFLPSAMPRLVGVSVAVIVGVWEFCASFPAEIVLWQRISKRGLPGRSSFAPWTTLILRYLMLCFSVSTAFLEWSTTMQTDAACQTASGFWISSWAALVVVSAFAIAWRAQAVARGIMQNSSTIRLMQILIATLVLAQVLVTIFAAVWISLRQKFFEPIEVLGHCTNPVFAGGHSHRAFFYRPRPAYYEDPLLWFWVFLIIFNLSCLIIVMAALRTLASRSRGFSKFINGMRNHSVFYFVIVLLLTIMCIVWRKVRNAGWLIMPTTVVEAAVMVRILLAEQNAARRPVDTTFMDHNGPSRYLSTRGGYPTQADTTHAPYPRGDATIQFADQAAHTQMRQSGDNADANCSEDGVGGEGRNNSGSGLPAHTAMTMRPIYQPYSMMDNLGQAFSQVDSHNPHDLDGQSLDLSQRGSLSIGPPSMYPGVDAYDTEEERRVQHLSERDVGGGALADKDGTPLSGTNASDASAECEEKDILPDSTATPTLRNRGFTGTSAVSRKSAEETMRSRILRGINRRSLDQDGADDDDDDDEDEDVGIQTVHF